MNHSRTEPIAVCANRLDQHQALQQRLRRLGLVRGVSALPPSPRRPVALENLVPGAFYETPQGRCFVAQADFPLEYRHGNRPVGDFLSLSPEVLAEVGDQPALAGTAPGQVLFLDTETTGLSGGTGTMAFLVGLGFFAGDRFHLLQAFLRDPGDEPALIAFLAERLPCFAALVTFNGRGFDLPILQTRFVLARRPFPLECVLHLDLLLLARRLWHERLPSRALAVLEREVLEVYRDQADVPSGVIPALYRDYLRTGDAREMSRVLYHNRMDILSLVTLAVQVCRAFANPLEEPGLSGAELLALARWYGQVGKGTEAILQAALRTAWSPALRVRVLRGLALEQKRQQRWGQATQWWQQLAVEDPLDILAPVELAKTFEWHLGRPALAAGWTRLALARVIRWTDSPRREEAVAELRHRLQRLERRTSAIGNTLGPPEHAGLKSGAGESLPAPPPSRRRGPPERAGLKSGAGGSLLAPPPSRRRGPQSAPA